MVRRPEPGTKVNANGVEDAVTTSDQDERVATDARPQQRGRHHRDLTTGSIPKNLFHQSWPQVFEGVFTVVDQIFDLLWAGRLPGGFRAIASVGVVQTWTLLGLTAISGLQQSTRAMVSRAVGAGDERLASHVALQSLTINLVYSILLITLGALFTPFLLDIVGVSSEIKAEAAAYMRLQFVNMALASFRVTSAAALQASGDPVTAFRGLVAQRVTRMVLAPLLMFGWLGLPEMGLVGASVASIIAQFSALSLNLYMLFRGNTLLRLKISGYRVDLPVMASLLRIGVPASVVGVERSVSQLILLGFVTPFGDTAVAAYAVTRRMEAFANFATIGIGQGTGTMVGQNLGAQHPERARQSVHWGLIYAGLAGAVMCGALLAFPEAFINIFTSNSEVTGLGADWLQAQAAAFFALGLYVIFAQSFNTAGDTMPALVITILSVWILEIPISWVLTQHTDIGPIGIAYAAIASTTMRIALCVPYFLTDRWMRKKVI